MKQGEVTEGSDEEEMLLLTKNSIHPCFQIPMPRVRIEIKLPRTEKALLGNKHFHVCDQTPLAHLESITDDTFVLSLTHPL